MTYVQKMKNENAEYEVSGVTYGYNSKTQKFYMEAGKEYFEFEQKSQHYYDMLNRINNTYM